MSRFNSSTSSLDGFMMLLQEMLQTRGGLRADEMFDFAAINFGLMLRHAKHVGEKNLERRLLTLDSLDDFESFAGKFDHAMLVGHHVAAFFERPEIDGHTAASDAELFRDVGNAGPAAVPGA